MIHYFKTYIRHILHKPLLYSLNLVGMVLGLLAFILINYYTLHQYNFNSFHNNYDKIVRLTTKISNNGNETHFAISSKRSAPDLELFFPEIKSVCRTSRNPSNISINNKPFQNQIILFSDTTLFTIFTFDIIKGNKSPNQQNPLDIYITEEASIRYFGESEAIGQSININSRNIDKTYTVKGIVKNPPSNSTINFDIICPFENIKSTFGETYGHVGPINSYLLLSSSVGVEVINSRLQEFYNTRLGDLIGIISFDLQWFSDIYFTTDLSYDFGPRGNKSNIQILIILSFFILILSCINFINLTTAATQSRGKEIGIKKILGINKFDLILQSYFETSLTVLIAILLALGFSQLMLPYTNDFAGVELSDSLSSGLDLFYYLAILWVVVSLSSGFYLAIVVSNKDALQSLKNRNEPSNKFGLQKILVTIQFAVSALSIMSLLIVQNQIAFLLKKDLGYNQEGVIDISIGSLNITPEKFETVKSSIANITGVKNTTRSISGITNEMARFPFTMAEDSAANFQMLNYNEVDEHYTAVHQIPFLVGRAIESHDQIAYIVNESAAKKLGYNDLNSILGQTLVMGQSETELRGKIVGVVSDFHFRPLHFAIEPLILIKRPPRPDGGRNFLTVQLYHGKGEEVVRQIEEQWKTFFPNDEFNFEYVSEDYQNNYAQEQRLSDISNLVTIILLIICMLGLLGLTIFDLDKKTKEVGIRKTLGASVRQLIFYLGKPIIILVIIGNLIAAPLAYKAASLWLETFVYAATIDWYIFPLTLFITILSALITTIIMIRKVAKNNPIEALKYE